MHPVAPDEIAQDSIVLLFVVKNLVQDGHTGLVAKLSELPSILRDVPAFVDFQPPKG